MGIKDFLRVKIGDNVIRDFGESQSNITGMRLVVDAFNVIYRNMILGNKLSHEGKSTGHIKITLDKLALFKRNCVQSMWIFDGGQCELKRETCEKRRQTNKIKLTTENVDDIKKLLRLAGVPYLVVPTEAEFYAAELTKPRGKLPPLFDAVLTSDMDVIVRGGNLIKEEFTSGKRTYFYLSSAELQKQTQLTREDLARIAIHLGCDFAPKTPRIGAKTVVKKINNDLTPRQQQALDFLLADIDLKDIIDNKAAAKPDIASLREWLLGLAFQEKTISKFTDLF